MTYFSHREWEHDMDILSSLFSELHISQCVSVPAPTQQSNVTDDNHLCVVCRCVTDNVVQNLCEKNCKYLCHTDCLNHWIIYKGYGVYCMICGLSHNSDYIANVFTESKFFMHH